MNTILTLIVLLALPPMLISIAPLPAAKVGKPAPDFVLNDLNSEAAIKLSDYNGKVVLLDFWASWCAPCKHSLPKLSELKESIPNLEIVTITIDDKAQNAERFIERLKLDLPAGFDVKKEVAEAYGVSAMPSAFTKRRPQTRMSRCFSKAR